MNWLGVGDGQGGKSIPSVPPLPPNLSSVHNHMPLLATPTPTGALPESIAHLQSTPSQPAYQWLHERQLQSILVKLYHINSETKLQL